MDSRNRAMARLDAGETVRQIAQALSIARPSVLKWSGCRRSTAVPPGRIGGHVPRKIRGDQADWLRARLAEGAFTLLRAAGAKLFYLPAYSSDLNPIEQVIASSSPLRKAADRTKDPSGKGSARSSTRSPSKNAKTTSKFRI